MGFPTRSDINRAVQSQKMARGLKFRILVVEGLYYLCSENKGSDQLRGYREADLCLCFRICKKNGFLTTRLNLTIGLATVMVYFKHQGWQNIDCLGIHTWEIPEFPVMGNTHKSRDLSSIDHVGWNAVSTATV